jgi:hypothetical protein
VERVLGLDFCFERRPFGPEEDVHVLADPALLVQDPSLQARPLDLEAFDRLPDRSTLHPDLGGSAR